MQVIEIISESEGLTVRQRWANVFVFILSGLLLVFGLNLRSGIVNATSVYDSPQAGIQAYYPQNWLLDTSGDYIFRVRDMGAPTFKTTIQVAVYPIGPDAQERNVADQLTRDRVQALTDYRVQPLTEFSVPQGISGQALAYTYTGTDGSPFLQTVPTVVRGLDILVISGGQAVVITYRADADLFDSEYPRFSEFLRRLQF